MNQQTVLLQAQFDPKLKIYLLGQQCLILASTIVGILLIPFYIPIGIWWANRYFASLECKLTDKSLIFNRGVVFRVEKTIPLDKIQDFSVRTGPLLNALGLAGLRVETAGQSATGGSEADLIALIDARTFRDRVLAQRDAVAAQDSRKVERLPTEAAPETTQQLLREIRDSLRRIEGSLASRSKDE